MTGLTLIHRRDINFIREWDTYGYDSSPILRMDDLYCRIYKIYKSSREGFAFETVFACATIKYKEFTSSDDFKEDFFLKEYNLEQVKRLSDQKLLDFLNEWNDYSIDCGDYIICTTRM